MSVLNKYLCLIALFGSLQLTSCQGSANVYSGDCAESTVKPEFTFYAGYDGRPSVKVSLMDSTLCLRAGIMVRHGDMAGRIDVDEQIKLSPRQMDKLVRDLSLINGRAFNYDADLRVLPPRDAVFIIDNEIIFYAKEDFNYIDDFYISNLKPLIDDISEIFNIDIEQIPIG